MADVLRVRWLAAPAGPDLVRALEGEGVRLVGDSERCDVVVVDSASWSQGARAAATGGPAPLLMLVSTTDSQDLASMLARLPAPMVAESRTAHPLLLARRLRQLGAAPELDVDALTGLANRRGLQHWAKQQYNQEMIVVQFDVDHMEQLNSTWTHDIGDQVLAEVATRLEEHAPRGAMVARLGEDEFVVVNRLAETQPRMFAEYLRQGASLHSPSVTEHDQRGTLSAGLSAGVSSGRQDLETLMNQAHMALVAAKARGRDRTVEYEAMRKAESDSFEERAFEDMTLLVAQRAAETIASGGRRMFSFLRSEADTDPLTDLPNRRYFNKKLEWEMRLASEQMRTFSVVWVDIDHFGEFNKRFSYPVGDAVLRHVAHSLRDQVGDVGWVARWGGEEFAVVLAGYPLDLAVEFAEGLRAVVEVEDFIPEDRRKLHVTISAGVAEWTPGEGAREFLERLSTCVGQAKETRNAVFPRPSTPASAPS